MKLKKLVTLGLVTSMFISAMGNFVIAASEQEMSNNVETVTLNPIDATYVSQHGEDNTTNFHDEASILVNYTNRSGGDDAWGQYGYMKFNIGDLDRERIVSAKLRVYVEDAGDKTNSTRTISIYDTCESDWDGSAITWASGKSEPNTLLGSFTVNANGSSITDFGWREINVTDLLKDGIDPYISLMAKMTSEVGYRVAITSGTYSNSRDNMPELVIECTDTLSPKYSRKCLSATRDTYVDQNSSNGYTNYIDSEYLKVNYTNNESRSDYYGSYAYIDFDLSGVDIDDVSTAKLWFYVDKNSDVRNSTRTIGVFAPESTWSSSMTWWSGRVASNGDAIGTFTVNGNGLYVTNPGWKSIDITEYIKGISSDNASFMMKSIGGSAHPVSIRSNEYSDESTRPKLILTVSGPIESAFEDEIFLNAVRKAISKSEDEHIYPSDVAGITELDVSELDITSLAGIEYFTSLKELYCYVNELTSLDLSKNEQLEILDCSYNFELADLNLSNNTKLEYLDCNYANLSKLDVTNNTKLKKLICHSNPLGTIDIKKNTLLEELDTKDTGLTLIDMSNNPKLKKVNITQNYISSTERVILPENSELSLETTVKYSPQRTGDISKYFADKNFLELVRDSVGKPTGKIYQSDVDEITELNVYAHHLTSLDGIEHLTSLKTLNCASNDLVDLDLSSNRELTSVLCSDNDILSLDFTDNEDLEDINAYNNKLEEIDISENTLLKNVCVSRNNLTSLDLTSSGELEIVDLSNNKIKGDNFLSLPQDYDVELFALADENGQDTVFYNNTEFMLGPQIGRYIRVTATSESINRVALDIRTAPKAKIEVYDITDFCNVEGNTNFEDGDNPGRDIEEDETYQSYVSGIISGLNPLESSIPTSNNGKYAGQVTLRGSRDEYILLTVCYQATNLDDDDEISEDTEWEIDAAQVRVVTAIKPIVKAFQINTGNTGNRNNFGNTYIGRNGIGDVFDILTGDSMPRINFFGCPFYIYIELDNYEGVKNVIVEMNRNDKNPLIDGKRIVLNTNGNGVFVGTGTIAHDGEWVDGGWSREGKIHVLYTCENDTSSTGTEIGRGYNARLIVDPSGYIYEGVPSNRLQNVKTTVYYMNKDREAVEWDASEEDQKNPIFTDSKGSFEWFVPTGMWKVKAELEGYETYYTDWLPVPPAQMDVNFSMISREKPTVTQANAYPDGIEIQFNKYMYSEDMTTENIGVAIDGEAVSGQIILMDEEQDLWNGEHDTLLSGGTGNNYVSRIKFKPNTNLINGDNVHISINKNVRTYAGEIMTEHYANDLVVGVKPTSMSLYENDFSLLSVSPSSDEYYYVACGTTENLRIKIIPTESSIGKTLYLATDNSWAVSIPTQVTVGQDGWATIPVTGVLPLETSISMYLENSNLDNKIKVNVFTE